MSIDSHRVRTPLFPTYADVKVLLRVLDGVPRSTYMSMHNAIREQTGTPQNPVDWTDPDTWIEERLTGADADLARRIWVEGEQTLNPRHVYGPYLLAQTHDLLVTDGSDVFRLSERGRGFLQDDRAVVGDVDETEGLIQLLRILSTKPQAKRGDLIPEWSEYLQTYSKYGSPSTIPDTLRRRLNNLLDRGLVVRPSTGVYTISEAGLRHLEKNTGDAVVEDPRRHVMSAVVAFNNRQTEALRTQLAEMEPYAFEHLVRDLLEAMGYEDVLVTAASGDKGVDVVAKVQLGITEVTEVVQVKRHQSNIHRPTLDQLRGALPYHGALPRHLDHSQRFF